MAPVYTGQGGVIITLYTSSAVSNQVMACNSADTEAWSILGQSQHWRIDITIGQILCFEVAINM